MINVHSEEGITFKVNYTNYNFHESGQAHGPFACFLLVFPANLTANCFLFWGSSTRLGGSPSIQIIRGRTEPRTLSSPFYISGAWDFSCRVNSSVVGVISTTPGFMGVLPLKIIKILNLNLCFIRFAMFFLSK